MGGSLVITRSMRLKERLFWLNIVRIEGGDDGLRDAACRARALPRLVMRISKQEKKPPYTSMGCLSLGSSPFSGRFGQAMSCNRPG